MLLPVRLAGFALAAAGLARGMAHVVWGSLLLASDVVANTITQVVPLAKDCDCRHVAETITRSETIAEPILVFPSEDVMPLSVYYRGRNRLLAVPRPPGYDPWDQSTLRIQSPHAGARLLGADE